MFSSDNHSSGSMYLTDPKCLVTTEITQRQRSLYLLMCVCIYVYFGGGDKAFSFPKELESMQQYNLA